MATRTKRRHIISHTNGLTLSERIDTTRDPIRAQAATVRGLLLQIRAAEGDMDRAVV